MPEECGETGGQYNKASVFIERDIYALYLFDHHKYLLDQILRMTSYVAYKLGTLMIQQPQEQRLDRRTFTREQSGKRSGETLIKAISKRRERGKGAKALPGLSHTTSSISTTPILKTDETPLAQRNIPPLRIRKNKTIRRPGSDPYFMFMNSRSMSEGRPLSELAPWWECSAQD